MAEPSSTRQVRTFSFWHKHTTTMWLSLTLTLSHKHQTPPLPHTHTHKHSHAPVPDSSQNVFQIHQERAEQLRRTREGRYSTTRPLTTQTIRFAMVINSYDVHDNATTLVKAAQHKIVLVALSSSASCYRSHELQDVAHVAIEAVVKHFLGLRIGNAHNHYSSGGCGE